MEGRNSSLRKPLSINQLEWMKTEFRKRHGAVSNAIRELSADLLEFAWTKPPSCLPENRIFFLEQLIPHICAPNLGLHTLLCCGQLLAGSGQMIRQINAVFHSNKSLPDSDAKKLKYNKYEDLLNGLLDAVLEIAEKVKDGSDKEAFYNAFLVLALLVHEYGGAGLKELRLVSSRAFNVFLALRDEPDYGDARLFALCSRVLALKRKQSRSGGLIGVVSSHEVILPIGMLLFTFWFSGEFSLMFISVAAVLIIGSMVRKWNEIKREHDRASFVLAPGTNFGHEESEAERQRRVGFEMSHETDPKGIRFNIEQVGRRNDSQRKTNEKKNHID